LKVSPPKPERATLRIVKDKPPKGYGTPLEASYRYLPATPSHTALQKVRGYVDELFCERGIGYNSNGSRPANPVKRIFNLVSLQIFAAK
jgi:hypothetical protein